MSKAERNYDVHDRELLAIIKTFEAWRHYLAGSPHKINIWWDHCNLQYFRTTCKLNPQQARGSAELQDYNFQIMYIPGKLQARSDGLSQKCNHDDGFKDNKDQILLNNNLFVKRTGFVDIDSIRSPIQDNTNYDETSRQNPGSLKRRQSYNCSRLKGLEGSRQLGLLSQLAIHSKRPKLATDNCPASS